MVFVYWSIYDELWYCFECIGMVVERVVNFGIVWVYKYGGGKVCMVDGK
jgi:hypothetical protein